MAYPYEADQAGYPEEGAKTDQRGGLVAQMERTVEVLHKEIAHLEEHLSPVLRITESPDSVPQEVPPTAIGKVHYRIQDANRRLRELRERAEV